MSRTEKPVAVPAINQWVADAMAHAGMSQADMARELTAAGVGIYDRSKVQKMTRFRGVSADEAAAIARITGYAPALYSDDAAELMTIHAELSDQFRAHLLQIARSMLTEGSKKRGP